jgi:putative chitinase
MVTPDQLRAIFPGSPVPVLERFVRPLNECFQECGIETIERHAAFLAQYGHETAGFTRLEENLYYTSIEGLLAATRPQWDALDRDEAWGYLNQPERLANRVYAHRYGNGSEGSGDGWKYRGRGLCHLTFRGNYDRCGAALALDLVEQPDLLLEPGHAVGAGGWYWRSINANRYSYTDLHDLELLTRWINGGINGLKSRVELFERALKVLRAAS